MVSSPKQEREAIGSGQFLSLAEPKLLRLFSFVLLELVAVDGSQVLISGGSNLKSSLPFLSVLLSGIEFLGLVLSEFDRI